MPLGATVSVVLLAHCCLPTVTGSTAPLIQYFVPPLLVGLGAAAAALLTWRCLRHLHRNAYSVWASASISNQQTLSTAWTTATSLLVAAEVAGMLCVFVIYQVLEWLVRGVSASTAGTSLVAATASSYTSAHWTAYFGIGATVAAIWLQHMGSVCVGASNLGTKPTFKQYTGLEHSDARNPAVLIDTIAKQLGEFLPRVLDTFATSTLGATLTLVLLQHPIGGSTLALPVPVATLPWLLRGFGLLAALFGLVTLRATEQERLERSVFRSQIVTELVFFGATIGCITWLVGSWSPALLISALAGLALPSLLAHLRIFESPRSTPERAFAVGGLTDEHWYKMARLGRHLGRVVLLPAGMYALVLLLGLLALASLAPSSALVATLVALGTPSALSAWRGSANLACDVHATALLCGRLGRLPLPPEAQLRHQRLAEVLARTTPVTEPIRFDGGASLCALAAVFIGWTSPQPSAFLVPALVAISLLALLPCLLALATGLQRGAHSAQVQFVEISRQMRVLPKKGSTVQVPADFVPSYRSCVELMARDAGNGGLVPVALAVTLPIVVALAVARTADSPGPQATLLAMYLSVTVATGLVIVHAGQAAASASSLAGRNHLGGAPVGADSESDPFELVTFVQRTLAVSVPLLVKATTFVALAISAILS